MTFRLSSPLVLALILPLSGCKKDFSCDELKQGEWAIEFFDDLGENGDCPYEGEAVLNGEAHEIVCEVSDAQCVCNAGHEFGIYEVTVTNTETDETDFAVIDVDAAPEPHCIVRDAVHADGPSSGLGGRGGAGGSEN